MKAIRGMVGRRFLVVPIAAALLATAVAVSTGGRAGAEAQTWPTIATWPVCSTPDEVLCVEYAEWIDGAGVVTDVYSTTAAGSTTQVWRIRSAGTIEMDIQDRVTPPGEVQPGIPEGTYRTSIRTGSLDPTLSIVTGHVRDHRVTGDAVSGWKLTMSITPTQAAWGDNDTCRDVLWMCHATFMAQNAIFVGISRWVPQANASDFIGMYFSSNSQSQMTPILNPARRTITFGGAAPHWLPASYGSGDEINPGFFDAFIPRQLIENSFGMSLDTVTTESFIQESTTPLAPYAMVVTPTGILFRLGVTHWSINDPGIKFRPWPSIDLEVTGSRFNAHMGPGPGMSELPTGDVVFAACRDAACTSVDESTVVSGSLRRNSATSTASVARSSLPVDAPNYRAYYAGDATYPEGARAFAGAGAIPPMFAG